MSSSVFGDIFTVSTFGESHGIGVGVIIDGVTPGIPLDEKDVQKDMDRRKPGQSNVTTPRKESDTIQILSGVFEGKTTGTPIGIVLYNKNQKSSDYNEIKDKFRPGHADFTYLKKYGIRDYRGSGRASGRETASRVAAGTVAKKILEKHEIKIIAYTLEAAGVHCKNVDFAVIEQNPLRAADLTAAAEMEKKVLAAAEAGESYGGIIECVIKGVKAGAGDPVFEKLDANLAKAMMSLGAVKGFEVGSGFNCAAMSGSEHNDWIDKNGFKSNNAGGIIGGISTGQDIIFRIAVKPPSSISKPQRTIDLKGEEVDIITEGRHDPCICPRIVPVVEAMTAIVLVNACKKQAALQW